MSPSPARVEFLRLWPTKLIMRRLPGHAAQNAAFVDLVLADEARRAGATVRYQEQNFFDRTEPPVRWLTAQIRETVAAYLEFVGVKEHVEWTIEGWYNVNRLGDHHAPHAHPGAYLSGTYYVRIPEGRDPDVAVHEDAQAACISFHDPRPGADMVTLGTEPDARPVHLERPQPGTLLMWPAPLQHYVHPNLSREPRVSISYNIILAGWYGASE